MTTNLLNLAAFESELKEPLRLVRLALVGLRVERRS